MSEFQREDRYIVIKRSDLKKVPVAYRSHLVDPMFSLLGHLPRRECVVVESDWPEYDLVWRLIEDRVSGRPGLTVSYEHAGRMSAESRCTALQQQLNDRDQKLDEAATEAGKLRANIDALQQRLAEAEKLLMQGRDNIRRGLYEDDSEWEVLANFIDQFFARPGCADGEKQP